MVRRSAALLVVLAACSKGANSDTQAPPAIPEPAPPVSAPVPGPAGGTAAAFTCDDSTVVYAIFRTDSAGASEVALAIGDDRLHLPQQVSASGARYADSTTTFWNKGDEATFERKGRKTTTCHVAK